MEKKKVEYSFWIPEKSWYLGTNTPPCFWLSGTLALVLDDGVVERGVEQDGDTGQEDAMALLLLLRGEVEGGERGGIPWQLNSL